MCSSICHGCSFHPLIPANKAFSNELEEDLRADKEYSEKWTLRGFMRVCEGLIIKWQKAHYDEVVRGGKRKDTEADSDKSTRQRAGSSSVIVKAGEYCEGCGKPRHKRETCQLTGHPNYNEKGNGSTAKDISRRKPGTKPMAEGMTTQN